MRGLIPVLILVACLAGDAGAADLPGMAAGILKEAGLARQAVSSHNPTAALDHIRKAEILTGEIENNAPPEPRPILVPVYKEVDTTSTYRPVKRSKESGLTPKRLENDTSVREVQAQITTGELDVTSSGQRLRQAQTAIESGNWTEADGQLAAIPDSVIRKQVEADMPLLTARQNLVLARSRILEGKYKDAKAPLYAAARALGDYERLSPYGAHNQDAEYMRQQIDSCADHIKRQHTEMLARVDGWLEPVNQWIHAELS